MPGELRFLNPEGMSSGSTQSCCQKWGELTMNLRTWGCQMERRKNKEVSGEMPQSSHQERGGPLPEDKERPWEGSRPGEHTWTKSPCLHGGELFLGAGGRHSGLDMTESCQEVGAV